MSGMKTSDLKLRTKSFALQIIKFCEHLQTDDTSKTLGPHHCASAADDHSHLNKPSKQVKEYKLRA